MRTSRKIKAINTWSTRVWCPESEGHFEVYVDGIYLDAIQNKPDLVFMCDCPLCDQKHEIVVNSIPAHIRRYLEDLP